MKKFMSKNSHKRVGIPALLYSVVILLTACNNDDSIIKGLENNNEMTTVQFEINAKNLVNGISSRAITPTYSQEGFSIYAFKQTDDGSDYVFSQMLELSNAVYSTDTKRLTGTASLPTGTYKFIPAYGINTNQNVGIPALTGSALTDELSLSYSPSGADGNNIPEIFLLNNTGYNNSLDNVRAYEMDLTESLNETVSLLLTRAVGRLDVMFIRARKNGSEYIELPYSNGQNIFGGYGLGRMDYILSDVNQNMNLLGLRQPGTTNATINVPNLGANGNAITIGTRPSASIIDDNTYFRFDSIQTDDIIAGSAHVFGSYLIPNNDESRTISMRLYVESADGSRNRTINVTTSNETLLPLARNKVTLVKIYILDNGGTIDPPTPPVDPPGPIDPPGPVDPPPSVFDPEVTFEAIIEYDWEISNEVTDIIDI